MTAPGGQSGVMAWWSAGVVLAVAFVRMTTIASGDLPYWFTDPWVRLTPEATITPMISLLLDALVWLGAAGMALHEHKHGRRVPVWTLGAILVGAQVVGLQGFVLRSPEAMGGADGVRGHFGSFLLGSVWVSAMLGAWTLWIGARDSAIRNTLLSIILGSAVLFSIKAVVNVTLEHGSLVDQYRESPGVFLSQSGIEPGTPEAAVFERRLLEPQATGWIALSNAFATLAGAMALGLGVVVIGGWRARASGGVRAGQIAGVFVVMALACAALVLSRSKGGAASVVFASGLLALLSVLRKRLSTRLLIALVVLATLAPLGAIVARGAMGDAMSERSLLFRWHYLIGAARIIADHPIFGVGAEGFKSAYLQVRPPDAVEEVSSPHSVLFDWVACLGAAGVAWCGVWFAWVARGARNAIDAPAEVSEYSARQEFRADAMTLGAAGFAGGVSLWSEWAALTQVTAGLHLVGFLLWVAAARAVRLVVVRLPDRAVTASAIGMALVVAVHAQMEVTPVIVGSAGLALAMLGLAAASPSEPPARVGGNKGPFTLVMAGLLLAGGVAVGGYSLVTVRAWELMLKRSAWELAHPSPPGTMSVHPQVIEHDRLPTESAALHAALRVRLAQLSGTRGRQNEDEMAQQFLLNEGYAVDLATELTRAWPSDPASWSALARTQELVFRTGAGGREWQGRALASWRRAAELDPRGVGPVFEIWRLSAAVAARVGGAGGAGGEQTSESIDLAQRVLDMDDRAKRMDPLRGLSTGERREVERWLGGGGED